MGRSFRGRNYRPNDWHSTYVSPWPTVVRKALPAYQKIRDRQLSGYGSLEPSHLRAILRAQPDGVIASLRAKAKPFDVEPPCLSGDWPDEPLEPGPSPEQLREPQWGEYEPRPVFASWWDGVKAHLSGKVSRDEKEAWSRYEAALKEWRFKRKTVERAIESHQQLVLAYQQQKARYAADRRRLEEELAAELVRHAGERDRFGAERAADLAAFDGLIEAASTGSVDGVEALVRQICVAIPLPPAFDRNCEARFDPDEGILLVEIQLPNIAEVGLSVQLKTKMRHATEREMRTAQEFVTHALPLRIIHEVFATAVLDRVAMVGVNARLAHTDRRTGQRRDEIVSSLAATRGEFEEIDISAVDPALCFRNLKGVSTPSFQDVSPIRPLLSFDRGDRRIVESRDVVDKLEVETNLAAMDWEDFEHVVRELFSKMFTARSASAEVHVTRASRDYGVDALVHDPDPIHGGKFVIQAKRYVNTVEVSAVRDLFGTVQNEGANRGYLVTTSSFGPDAHAFAKGKPLSLIEGAHLLQLLKDYGYSFRINLAEARQLLHGRRGSTT